MLEAWCLNHPQVQAIIKHEWAKEIQGSSAFILQRKLQNSLRIIRNWCLNFNEKNGLSWSNINQELTTKQQKIIDQTDVAKDIESRSKMED